jgi:hypothetical protein
MPPSGATVIRTLVSGIEAGVGSPVASSYRHLRNVVPTSILATDDTS